MEHAARGLDPAADTNAFARVTSAKEIETASPSTPRIPDGVISHPSEPQFSSSQASIYGSRLSKPQGGTAILMRTAKRRGVDFDAKRSKSPRGRNRAKVIVAVGAFSS
jgi:hypothetical protein